MALFKIYKGLSDNLKNTPDPQKEDVTQLTKEGHCYFTTDDGKFYIDIVNNAVPVYPNSEGNNFSEVTRMPINAFKADKAAIAEWSARALADVNGNNIHTHYAHSLGIDGYKLKLIAADTTNTVLSEITLPNNVETAKKFTSNQTIKLTGAVTGEKSSQAGWEIATTLADNIVTNTKIANGAVSNGKIANATIQNEKLVNSSIKINGTSVSLGGSLTLADIGLSSALRFIGTTTTAIVDGGTTDPIIIGGNEVKPTIGDVVINSNNSQEYVWLGTKWELLGDESSYALKGHTHNYAGSSSEGGAANSAIKLTTARTITLTGDVTGSGTFDGSDDVNITTSLAGSHTHDQYLPLTAGEDKKLTGPLGLTKDIMYGPSLPTTNTFDGQLFFLEDNGAALPAGGSVGQTLVKNSDDDGDASWKSSSISWVAGTSSGPQPKIFEVIGDAIPAASGSTSGIVTTVDQAFVGTKYFYGALYSANSTQNGVELWTDGEGGNISIFPPSSTGVESWNIDSYNGDLRFFCYVDGTAKTGPHIKSSDMGIYGAVWNDYAEFRTQKENIEPGYCVASADNGQVYKTTEKFQACDGIVSDTFGFAIGETDECQTPLAVAGRVLAYFHGNREDYHSGDTVCAGPEGKVMKMTREEIREWPDRIIGIVSEIPEYERWGSGNVEVNNRIWIKVK